MVGLDGLGRIRAVTTLPLVAIGGIAVENAGEVIAAGADSVAVISAIVQAEDITFAARQIAARCRRQNEPVN